MELSIRATAVESARLRALWTNVRPRASCIRQPTASEIVMSRLKVVRGMKDILPVDAPRWHHLEDLARSVFESYGFQEMRTPVLEHTELFLRSIGEATDIVEKEMYTFADRRGRSLTLRPEATASCVRAAVEHGLTRGSDALRIWYSGPMFRYEKMQKERYRQFYQLGAEIYAQPEPTADAEIILITARLWRALGLANVQLQINSLGTRDEQATYRGRLREYLQDHFKDLDEDSQRRLASNPLRVLDSKNPALQDIIEAAPVPTDELGETSREHFSQV
ncbi:MAG: histidyl-tRNA synthetase, partial [Gammaproteobacteria bacterium]